MKPIKSLKNCDTELNNLAKKIKYKCTYLTCNLEYDTILGYKRHFSYYNHKLYCAPTQIKKCPFDGCFETQNLELHYRTNHPGCEKLLSDTQLQSEKISNIYQYNPNRENLKNKKNNSNKETVKDDFKADYKNGFEDDIEEYYKKEYYKDDFNDDYKKDDFNDDYKKYDFNDDYKKDNKNNRGIKKRNNLPENRIFDTLPFSTFLSKETFFGDIFLHFFPKGVVEIFDKTQPGIYFCRVIGCERCFKSIVAYKYHCKTYIHNFFALFKRYCQIKDISQNYLIYKKNFKKKFKIKNLFLLTGVTHHTSTQPDQFYDLKFSLSNEAEESRINGISSKQIILDRLSKRKHRIDKDNIIGKLENGKFNLKNMGPSSFFNYCVENEKNNYRDSNRSTEEIKKFKEYFESDEVINENFKRKNELHPKVLFNDDIFDLFSNGFDDNVKENGDILGNIAKLSNDHDDEFICDYDKNLTDDHNQNMTGGDNISDHVLREKFKRKKTIKSDNSPNEDDLNNQQLINQSRKHFSKKQLALSLKKDKYNPDNIKKIRVEDFVTIKNLNHEITAVVAKKEMGLFYVAMNGNEVYNFEKNKNLDIINSQNETDHGAEETDLDFNKLNNDPESLITCKDEAYSNKDKIYNNGPSNNKDKFYNNEPSNDKKEYENRKPPLDKDIENLKMNKCSGNNEKKDEITLKNSSILNIIRDTEIVGEITFDYGSILKMKLIQGNENELVILFSDMKLRHINLENQEVFEYESGSVFDFDVFENIVISTDGLRLCKYLGKELISTTINVDSPIISISCVPKLKYDGTGVMLDIYFLDISGKIACCDENFRSSRIVYSCCGVTHIKKIENSNLLLLSDTFDGATKMFNIDDKKFKSKNFAPKFVSCADRDKNIIFTGGYDGSVFLNLMTKRKIFSKNILQCIRAEDGFMLDFNPQTNVDDFKYDPMIKVINIFVTKESVVVFFANGCVVFISKYFIL
ncbi:hypothetical protein DMUE_1003 [Dictyocoela muelleri]|nr:hypothetical protein DMUE_1003 [Dictyocoela muelleri]